MRRSRRRSGRPCWIYPGRRSMTQQEAVYLDDKAPKNMHEFLGFAHS